MEEPEVMTAKYITEITIIDPDTDDVVSVAIYKEVESGGMFGIDSSYLESLDVDIVPSVFDNGKVKLVGD